MFIYLPQLCYSLKVVKLTESRVRWDSRLIFLLAAIGSAIGLGNLWRFPYLTYKFGGGAFLIPYLIALLVIGIPVLILEFALGQKMQKGAMGAFRKIDGRLIGIGFLAVLACIVAVAYYAVVMGWSLVYMLGSFHSPLPWSTDAENFFLNNVLQRTGSPSELGSISIVLVIALSLVWITLFFCVFRGIKSVGRIVWVSMPLSLILLLVLFFRAITLEGALNGISYYLRPNFSLLLSLDLWVAAVSQVFFSLSLGFGVMIAYASFNSPKQSITRNAFALALASTGLSLLAGFVVFGVLGHMAFVQNIPIEEVATSGPSLAFIVFAHAFGLFPLAWLFSFLFFLTLFVLGIDTAFSLLESITTVVKDSWRKISTSVAAFVVCGLGLLSGLLFITGAGFYLLDIVDHYAISYILLIIGLMQCIAVGWVYGAENLRLYINSVSKMKIGIWWDICIKWVAPLSLGTLLTLQLLADFKQPYGGYPGWVQSIGFGAVLIPLAIAALLAFFPLKANVFKKRR